MPPLETPQEQSVVPKVFKTCVIAGLNEEERLYIEYQLDVLKRRGIFTVAIEEDKIKLTVPEKNDSRNEILSPLEHAKLALSGITEGFPSAKFEFSES